MKCAQKAGSCRAVQPMLQYSLTVINIIYKNINICFKFKIKNILGLGTLL